MKLPSLPITIPSPTYRGRHGAKSMLQPRWQVVASATSKLKETTTPTRPSSQDYVGAPMDDKKRAVSCPLSRLIALSGSAATSRVRRQGRHRRSSLRCKRALATCGLMPLAASWLVTFDQCDAAQFDERKFGDVLERATEPRDMVVQLKRLCRKVMGNAMMGEYSFLSSL